MILYRKLESGDFLLEQDEEILDELRLLIGHLEGITSFVKSDHIMNLLEELEGRLPEDKEKMLRKIDCYSDSVLTKGLSIGWVGGPVCTEAPMIFATRSPTAA